MVSETSQRFVLLDPSTSRPDRVVCVGRDGPRTVEELTDHVARLATVLARIDGMERVLLVCEDRYHFLVALLASWIHDLPVVLPPNASSATLSSLAAQSGTHLVHDGGHVEGIDLLEAVAACPTAPARPVTLAADQHVASLYTSGTTGDHARHAKRADQLIGEADMLVGAFELGSDTTVLSSVPPHHIYGLLFSLLVPLRAGGCFIRETPLHAEAVSHAAKQHGANVLVTVPAHMRGLEVAPTMPAFRRVFSSSAPLPWRLAESLHRRFEMVVTEVFGSTETGGIGWREQVSDPVWTAFEAVTIGVGEEERLTLASPFADSPDRMMTGDRIELRETAGAAQRFAHLGRIDDVTKVAGRRVTIGEVRARLLELDGVDDAEVQAVAVSSAHGTALRAAVVSGVHDAASLRRELRRWFDAVVIPRRFVFVESLPRGPSGKVTRADLDALFAAATRRVRAEVTLHDDYVAGHFPGKPVVPGAAQIVGLVVGLVRETWPALGPVRGLRNVKFRSGLRGDESVTVELERHGVDRVDFSVLDRGTVVTGGRLRFGL